MGKLIAALLKKIAEGGFGERPKQIYWALAGIKTYLGLAFAVLSFGLSQAHERGLCISCADYNGMLLSVAAFLVSIGLLDGALRTDPPKP